MTEGLDTALVPLGASATRSRRSFAALLRHGFQLLGGMDRGEILQMLAAHGAPAEMLELVRERVPEGTRVAGLRGLWEHLEELPLGEDDPPKDGAAPQLLQIGAVAERVGLSLRSVRYYDEAGLVRPSARTDGNFRLYSERDVERLRAVRDMKPYGLSTEEMHVLATLLDRSERPELLAAGEAAAIRAQLEEFAVRGDERIARLERDLEQARALRLRIGEHIARCA